MWDTSCEVGFPIRTSRDHCQLPTPPRFSQAATSFFASDRQGIHRRRLFACSYNSKSPSSYIQDSPNCLNDTSKLGKSSDACYVPNCQRTPSNLNVRRPLIL